MCTLSSEALSLPKLSHRQTLALFIKMTQDEHYIHINFNRRRSRDGGPGGLNQQPLQLPLQVPRFSAVERMEGMMAI